MPRHRLAALIALVFTAGLLTARALPRQADGGREAFAAAMAKLGPGEEHALLASLAGEWELEGRFRMAPQAPWMELGSKASARWILGDRFLEQELEGEPSAFMPQPYRARTFLGYDRFAERFVYLVLDNFTTAVKHYEGEYDAGERLLSLRTEHFQPMHGRVVPLRSTLTLESDDRFVLRDYEVDPAGEEYLALEAAYVRVP